jgi:hypothetical protein
MTKTKRNYNGSTGERISRRAGLSVLEFVGCAMAVIGGAWLGALYLGIDVRHVAHAALSESKLLENVPENWRPQGTDENPMTREQLVGTLREELGTLRSEIAALRNHDAKQDDLQAKVQGGTETTSQDATPEESSKSNTLAYWIRLNEIATGEVTLQRDADTEFDNENAAQVFAIKGRIHRFAGKAIDAIPQADVDPAVVQVGRQLGDWYKGGAELNDKAVRIWETAAGSQGRAQLNEEWSRAQMQHRNEATLLNEKASAVRGAVSRRFKQEFPEFVGPKTELEPLGQEG